MDLGVKPVPCISTRPWSVTFSRESASFGLTARSPQDTRAPNNRTMSNLFGKRHLVMSCLELGYVRAHVCLCINNPDFHHANRKKERLDIVFELSLIICEKRDRVVFRPVRFLQMRNRVRERG